MSTLQIERVASLQPHSIVLYKAYPASSRESGGEASLLNLEKGKSGEYNGYLSPSTARKIKKILSCWLLALEENIKRAPDAANRFFPTFVTLTLPSAQAHTDNEVKRKLLDPFILEIKKKFGVKHYFWRAEDQKNGNIHFHLICDRWMSWKALRAVWNNILKRNGYIEAYREAQLEHHKTGFTVRREMLKTWPLDRQKAAFDEGTRNNWSDPNTVDVHKINKLTSITAYVVKYVCKKSEPGKGRKIGGRIWGCSDELRELGYYTDTHSLEMNFQHTGNPDVVDYVAQVEKEVGAGEVFEDEFIKVIRLKHPQSHYLKKYAPSLHKSYRNHYRTIYKELYEGYVKKPAFERVEQEIVAPEPITLERFGPKIVQIGMKF